MDRAARDRQIATGAAADAARPVAAPTVSEQATSAAEVVAAGHGRARAGVLRRHRRSGPVTGIPHAMPPTR